MGQILLAKVKEASKYGITCTKTELKFGWLDFALSFGIIKIGICSGKSYFEIM